MTEERFRKAFLILLVLAISAAFLAMIRMFLLTMLLAAIFAGVARALWASSTQNSRSRWLGPGRWTVRWRFHPLELLERLASLARCPRPT